MNTFFGDIFSFIALNADYIVLTVCALIFLESLVYIIFPRHIKKAVQRCPVNLMRAAGVIFLILSILLALLYINMAQT